MLYPTCCLHLLGGPHDGLHVPSRLPVGALVICPAGVTLEAARELAGDVRENMPVCVAVRPANTSANVYKLDADNPGGDGPCWRLLYAPPAAPAKGGV